MWDHEQKRWLPRRGFATALLAALAWAGAAAAEPLSVRYTEGLIRGFLALRTLDGETIAGGDLHQVQRDGKVTNRLVFHFQDGSIHDETTVFTQRRHFRLLSYRLVQKGPAFPTPVDISIDGPKNQAVIRYTDEDGQQKVETEDSELPADLANGLVLTLAKNIAPGTPETTLSMVAPTPELRLVKLKITPAGEESFSVGGRRHDAMHYVVKVEIGGITGVLASLLGKNPPDHHVWVIQGDTPGFVKAEGPLYLGGPPWRIELASPQWPERAAAQR